MRGSDADLDVLADIGVLERALGPRFAPGLVADSNFLRCVVRHDDLLRDLLVFFLDQFHNIRRIVLQNSYGSRNIG